MAVKKVQLPVRIDPELLRRLDEARGDVSRTRFVERAIELRLMNPYSSVTRATVREEYDRALESASSETRGSAPVSRPTQAPVPSSEGVRSAVPSRASVESDAMKRQRLMNEAKYKR